MVEMTSSSELTNDYSQRFSGIARLYGDKGLERLAAAHVCVVGVGGVGSWAVEALARSGVGALSLIDLDEVCISNVNRQLPALDGFIGKPKVDVLAERVRAINPGCAVEVHQAFLTARTAEELLSPSYSWMLDAIDTVKIKCLIIDECRKRSQPLVTAGGTGGKIDPTKIEVADLSRSFKDPLFAKVRKRLRQHYGYPRDELTPFGVTCVFSPEEMIYPKGDGTVCREKTGDAHVNLDCDSGYGTAAYVTGAFGFAAAAHIVKEIAAGSS